MGDIALVSPSAPAISSDTLEQLVIKGDIKGLTPKAKVEYYTMLCRSLDLNPASQPFQVIAFQGREQLYAKKDATDQLRDRRGISITKIEKEVIEGVLMVTAYGRDRNGRTDASTGAVNIKGLSGEALANAYMKAETKAKRRLTLSLSGLGMLDESEIEAVPGVREIKAIDTTTGETTVTEIHEVAEPKISPQRQRYNALKGNANLTDSEKADLLRSLQEEKTAEGQNKVLDFWENAVMKRGRFVMTPEADAGASEAFDKG